MTLQTPSGGLSGEGPGHRPGLRTRLSRVIVMDTVPRRTISIPPRIDALVRETAHEGESFSAAVVRLIEAGMVSSGQRRPPSYVAAGEGPEDLGEKAELYLKELVQAR